MKNLSNTELSALCRELSLLVHAGVGLGDGLYLLAEEEKNGARREMLQAAARCIEDGASLTEAFAKAGCFPQSVTGLIRVGEQTGKLEDTLCALAQHYEERERMERQMRNMLLYPAILLLLMLVVIVALLGKVLPVFNEIYASLGGQLTGVAGGLLRIGQALDAGMPVLCGVLAAILLAGMLFALCDGIRGRVMRAWNRRDRGTARLRNNARFVQALSMGMASGLYAEDALELCAQLLEDVPDAKKRCMECREKTEQGVPLATALEETGMMPHASCRLLHLGMRSGAGDTVIRQIAAQMAEEVEQKSARRLASIEPTMVLVLAVLVGIILLSVMLPLMNIMTAIG